MRTAVLVLVVLLGPAAKALIAGPLDGSWQFEARHSTELSPWSALRLNLRTEGDEVVIERFFGAGRRSFADELRADTSGRPVSQPVAWWPDNRHIGAYAGGPQIIRASLLEGGRILRLDCDLTLETSQGSRRVNILRQFTLSASGDRLTLTELRSTRPVPVVYSFTRAAPSQR